VIADHTYVALYDTIPQLWIDEVKKMLVNIAGESHSRAFLNGAYILGDQDARFPCDPVKYDATAPNDIPSTYRTDALRLSNGMKDGSYFENCGETDYYTNATGIALTKSHLAWCNSNSRTIKAFGFGWCWDMTWHNGVTETKDSVYGCGWAGASVGGAEGDLAWGLDAADTAITANSICMDTYLAATEDYISYCASEGIPTTVMLTTGPLDGYLGESGYQRHVKHEYIRDYAAAHPTVHLFDCADIIAWSNAGAERIETWSGHNYQMLHTANDADIGSYDDATLYGDDHIGQVGAVRLAKALWVFLARLAGWIPLNDRLVLGIMS
jgi:hypothetical protein